MTAPLHSLPLAEALEVRRRRASTTTEAPSPLALPTARRGARSRLSRSGRHGGGEGFERASQRVRSALPLPPASQALPAEEDALHGGVSTGGEDD
jgi:hypothetical protein